MSENPLLPPCPGPKLHAFQHQDAKIHWGRRVDDDRSNDGTEGFVFSVTINSKIYVLKVLKFFDPEDTQSFWEAHLGDSYPPEKIIFYTDPFYAECRAFGRIQQAYDNQEIHHRRVLAVKCHGYMFLKKNDQLALEKKGCYFGADLLDDKILRASGGNGRVRVIVKDLEPDVGLNARKIRKAFERVYALNQLKIYNRDVRAANFVNCRLVDFGLSWTQPHEILEALAKDESRDEKLGDRVMFNDMIAVEGIKTRLNVLPDTGYWTKLRAWSKAEELVSLP
ncbi:kinetochore Sim4 complex subunit FTA2-domain-containing protein [Ustulina deusta]|nr:kinetochore Sim4 complex subunit FTA2-domain-containing protein [Ustulina deusta]